MEIEIPDAPPPNASPSELRDAVLSARAAARCAAYRLAAVTDAHRTAAAAAGEASVEHESTVRELEETKQELARLRANFGIISSSSSSSSPTDTPVGDETTVSRGRARYVSNYSANPVLNRLPPSVAREAAENAAAKNAEEVNRLLALVEKLRAENALLQEERDAAVEERMVATTLAKAALGQADAAARAAAHAAASPPPSPESSHRGGRKGATLSSLSLSSFHSPPRDDDDELSVDVTEHDATSLLAGAYAEQTMDDDQLASFYHARDTKLARRRKHHSDRSQYLASVASPEPTPPSPSRAQKIRAKHAVSASRSLVSWNDDDDGSSDSSGIGSGDSLMSDLVHEVNTEMELQFAMEARHSKVVADLTAKMREIMAQAEDRERTLQAEINRLTSVVAVMELESPVFGIVSINGTSSIPFTCTETYEHTFLIQFNAPPGLTSVLVTNNARRHPSDAYAFSESVYEEFDSSGGLTASPTPSTGFLALPSRGGGGSKGMTPQLSLVSDTSLFSTGLSNVSSMSNLSTMSRYSTHAKAQDGDHPGSGIAEQAADAHEASKTVTAIIEPVFGMTIRETDSLKIGIEVVSVVPDGPAASAGLSEFDIVIAFNGRDVNSPRAWRKLAKAAHPSHPIHIKYICGMDGSVSSTHIIPAGRVSSSKIMGGGSTGGGGGGMMRRAPSIVALNHMTAEQRDELQRERESVGLDPLSTSLALLQSEGLV